MMLNIFGRTPLFLHVTLEVAMLDFVAPSRWLP